MRQRTAKVKQEIEEKARLVSGSEDSTAIPKELLKDLYLGLARVEEVLATLEELMDSEGLQRIRGSEEEYRRGEYETAEGSCGVKKLVE